MCPYLRLSRVLVAVAVLVRAKRALDNLSSPVHRDGISIKTSTQEHPRRDGFLEDSAPLWRGFFFKKASSSSMLRETVSRDSCSKPATGPRLSFALRRSSST